MAEIDEKIQAEVKNHSQTLNILSYWLKKSLTRSKESVRRSLMFTREYLRKINQRIDKLLKRKI
jgi:hypothetical protein